MSANTMLNFFPASGGDFFWLRYENDSNAANVIIDTGLRRDWISLRRVMNTIKHSGEAVEAVILTHIDDDHIGGFLRWLEAEEEPPQIRKLLFHTGADAAGSFVAEKATAKFTPTRAEACDYGVATASSIVELLARRGMRPCPEDRIVMGGAPFSLPFNATLRFISPSERTLAAFREKWRQEAPAQPQNYAAGRGTWEDLDELLSCGERPDTSVTNGASLAFLFDYGDTHIAFLGDAFAETCVEGLRAYGYSEAEPYRASLIKLSHHGSARNLSEELLQLLSGNSFLLSSSETKLSRTQKITVARLLNARDKVMLYTNFDLPVGFLSTRDRAEYVDSGRLSIMHVTQSRPEEIRDGLVLKG